MSEVISSKKILITGCSGFVGRQLVDSLLKTSEVDFACATSKFDPQTPKSIAVGRIGSNSDWRKALESVSHVIHLAGRAHVMQDKPEDLKLYKEVNLVGTLRLAEQAAVAGVKRMVFISTIKVCGDGSLTPQKYGYQETDISQHLNNDPYALSKHEAETGLLKIAQDTNLEICILRPPLVYGPGVKGNLLSLSRAIRRGFPLPFSYAKNNERSMVSVFNLIDAILTVLHHPNAKNETFNIADADAVSTKVLIELIAEAMNVAPKLVPIPKELFRVAAAVTGKSPLYARLFGNLKVDTRKISKELGWSPPRTLREDLHRAFAVNGGVD
ncbi:MAG: NAD-dependent epimerase/dehydratase family protein [Deltaproteobacteria bacterium]|nr:NAD-dependent epimerase/dehydratase family protein [Deltaproteobacteria bacterium]